MRTLLITGLNGWTGQYLAARLLRSEEVRIIGLGLKPQLRAPLHLLADRISYCSCDLTGPSDSIVSLLKGERIDGVIHLAGLTASADWPALLHTNVLGTVNLLKAIHTLRDAGDGDPPILVTSSSGVYAPTGPEDPPITEEHAVSPVTPYGVSKAAQELAAHRFFAAEGMRIVTVRTFNLVGPDQSSDFVCSSIAQQIARAEARDEPAYVRLGDLDRERDFVDVRDAVDVYLMLLDGGSEGHAYNCGSGIAHSIGRVVELLSTAASVEVFVEQRAERSRRGDVRSQRADVTRTFAATGWKCSIPLGTSLRDLLDGWRRRVAQEVQP